MVSHVIRLGKQLTAIHAELVISSMLLMELVGQTFRAATEHLGTPHGMLTQRSVVLMRPYATLELVF